MDAIQDATILIVDDEPDNLQTIENMFIDSNISCNIMKSPNGKTALKVVQKKLPDLIITDWDMPEMNGIELTHHLKENPATEDIPVIICTGAMTASTDLQTALTAGASDYIRKPVDPIELLARTHSMLQLGRSYKKIKEQNQALHESFAMVDRVARIDPLTQLPNRRDFLEKIEHEKASADRNGHTFALALSDIDNFKRFNDQYGHDCGDFVLTTVAKLLRENIRKQDYVGRWGGEEFIFLFPRTDLAGGCKIADKIRRAVADYVYRYQDHSLRITMTVGVCVYQRSGIIDEHLKWADEALYKGKKMGRNRVEAWQQPS